MNGVRIAAAFAAALTLAGSLALASAPKGLRQPPAAKPSAKVGEWNMTTDQMEVNLRTGSFTAPHHVSLTRADGSTIDADRATGNYRRKIASLFGHVAMHDVSGKFGLQSASQQQSGPATLTADEVDVNDVSRLYDASGNVHYEQGDSTVDAQTAHLNDVTHRLDLSGKVHVLQGDRTLDAENATYNTLTGEGEADGNVAMTFPGPKPSIATPKPIIIKNPKIPIP